MPSWDQYMASAEDAFRGGETAAALKMWLLAVRLAEEEEDYRHASLSLDRLAEVSGQLGNHADAEAVLLMALEVKEQVYGAHHSEVISSLSNLVDALHAQGKYDDALEYVNRLVQAYQTTFGAEHPGVATIAANMSAIYHEIGHPSAEEFYKQAIEVKTKMFGYNNEEVVALVRRYAVFLREQGRVEEAQRIEQAAVQTVSGVWRAVAQKMNEGSERLSERTGGLKGRAIKRRDTTNRFPPK
jgi:serine/threonine-protein kinase